MLVPVGLYILLCYFIFDFNYIAGILEAAKYENRHFNHNLLLLDSPTNFIFTRLECISEIIFMFGGLCAYFSYKSLIQKNEKMMLWTKFAILFFLLMILTGAYRTGETAWPFLGIYPLLLIPFAYHVKDNIKESNDKKNILAFTFLQSIILQILFWFYW